MTVRRSFDTAGPTTSTRAAIASAARRPPSKPKTVALDERWPPASRAAQIRRRARRRCRAAAEEARAKRAPAAALPPGRGRGAAGKTDGCRIGEEGGCVAGEGRRRERRAQPSEASSRARRRTRRSRPRDRSSALAVRDPRYAGQLGRPRGGARRRLLVRGRTAARVALDRLRWRLDAPPRRAPARRAASSPKRSGRGGRASPTGSRANGSPRLPGAVGLRDACRADPAGRQVVAVLCDADQQRERRIESPVVWPAILEVLARHATRCLEVTTAFNGAAQLMTDASAAQRSGRQQGESHASRGDEDEAARRYARLLFRRSSCTTSRRSSPVVAIATSPSGSAGKSRARARCTSSACLRRCGARTTSTPSSCGRSRRRLLAPRSDDMKKTGLWAGVAAMLSRRSRASDARGAAGTAAAGEPSAARSLQRAIGSCHARFHGCGSCRARPIASASRVKTFAEAVQLVDQQSYAKALPLLMQPSVLFRPAGRVCAVLRRGCRTAPRSSGAGPTSRSGASGEATGRVSRGSRRDRRSRARRGARRPPAPLEIYERCRSSPRRRRTTS